MNLPLEIKTPIGYQWLLDRGLVGFETFSQLQPWHYLPHEQCFWVSDRWPSLTDKRLFAFAKRQDCDDISCFLFDNNNELNGIALIEGWTENGFELIKEFSSFWSWLKHVVDDMASWVGEVE